MHFKSIAEIQQDLAAGRTTAAALTEAALQRAQDSKGEGKRVYLRLYAEQAMQAARAADQLRVAGVVASPLAGVPISIKDLLDVKGEPSTGASAVLADAPPATEDALVLKRLRAAGAIIIGRTNMPQFAYSGVGQNPHTGTPRNPFERDAGDVNKGRASGGSSSGAAISVTDGMAVAAIGSDTGGSIRIPAALCGLAGFKPTQARVPLTGVLPLSESLDSVGPLAACVADCALVDAVIAGEEPIAQTPVPLRRLRFARPKQCMFDELDSAVADAVAKAISKLSAAGAEIVDVDVPALARWPEILRTGHLIASEAYATHRAWMEAKRGLYDPRVYMRIELGAKLSAADYVAYTRQRSTTQHELTALLQDFDALIAPTVATVAPRLHEILNDNDAFVRANRLLVRSTGFINFIDGCSLTVPCQQPGALPVGLMLSGLRGTDHHILRVGMAVEKLLRA
jgi:aspartyl-tRNA(Asn)/glutamyl-tRNA(Gln) amidotransferase subunit A